MPPARFVSALAAAALVLAVAPAPAQLPFHVNTYTADVQGDPAVAARADGSFVVVWESTGQDGDYFGVFGRRFASDGSPAGSEFQANAYVFGRQAAPAVAVAGGGDFIVAWEGYGEGGDFGDIIARRFDAGGQPLGGEFQVNEVVPAYEVAPAVAAEADDGFIVVWDDYHDVLGRRYDSAGAARGGAFQVNAETTGTQMTASVAAIAGGGFVVAWADGYYLGNGHDGYGYGVFARRYDSTGAALGSQFQINTSTLGDQYGPAIAAMAGGGFVVVWQSYGHVGSESAVFGRRFDASGVPEGSEFQISAPTEDLAGPPAVSADQMGRFVVVWSSAPRAAIGRSVVLARRFAAGGAPLGTEFAVDAGTDADQLEPVDGALDGAGFVVVWRDDTADGTDAGVLAEILSATPAPTVTAGPSPTPTTPSASTPTATPPALPSPTATAPTSPSDTPPPTTTAAPPSATPTTASATCAGDCNDNGVVTVDDLILAVNIALGSQPSAHCPAADGNGDGSVTVAELITAVNRALGGCAT